MIAGEVGGLWVYGGDSSSAGAMGAAVAESAVDLALLGMVDAVESATIGVLANRIPEPAAGMPKAGLRIVEVLSVFFFRARQEIEERVEATVERPAKLRDGAVDRMQREACCLTIVQPELHVGRVGE